MYLCTVTLDGGVLRVDDNNRTSGMRISIKRLFPVHMQLDQRQEVEFQAAHYD